MFHQSSKHILLVIFVALLITMPVYAVKNYKFSNYAGGHQIWFEVEDYDERDPDTDEYFPVVNESGAFGKAINRTGVPGGMVRWTFDISKAGGKGGTWYFWGRVLNPSGSSDFMIVEGHPGDPTLPDGPPYPGTAEAPGFNDSDRLFYQDAGPPWTWSRADHAEAHTKQLQDGENTMYIIHRKGNNTVFWDVFMWTDNPDYVPTDADYRNAERPSAGAATNPGPANEATQSAASYAVPQRLDFNKTYYWRVDEVNGPPDFTVHKGDVWQFTVEPFAYPIENIIATASSQLSEDTGPQKTIDGSGLDENDLHSIEEADIWLSSMTGPQPTWIQYEFDQVYKLHQMWAWNHNTPVEPVFGFGIKDATIEYSVDGVDWTTLGTTHEFARAPGAAGYAANTTIGLSGAVAKYVKITANSNWGGIVPQYSLSEVRFFYIPICAREPSPDSGATDVDPDVVLSWRAGREAVTHDVYVSTDEQAVIDSTAPVAIVAETSYGPLSLNLGITHYWKINEVNEAESPAAWESNIWSFTVADFIAVDDFESYNDLDPDDPESKRIFNVWLDGYEVPTNGSLVGYENAPFCEQTIVHGGK
ncbi:MAG: discoidin domain-containing protein, partial [Planctomycetota bacterium]